MSDKPQKNPQYTGRIDRGANGEIVGKLADKFGWTIEITGTRDPAGGYVITGRLGATPSAYRIPAIDGDDQAPATDRR